MNLFQSKEYKNMHTMLQECTFYQETMKNFNFQSVATNVKDLHSPQAFLEVVTQSKLTPFTLTKALLVLLYLVQSEPSLQQLPNLDKFISKLQKKSERIAKRACKHEKHLVRSFSPSIFLTKV